ncbi:hypothetical protein ACOMHN_025990 [Nucella lapillus]
MVTLSGWKEKEKPELMAYLFIAVFLISIFYPVTHSQDSSWRKTTIFPDLHHHRHGHGRNGYDVDANKDDGVNMDPEQGKPERDEADGFSINQGHPADDWDMFSGSQSTSTVRASHTHQDSSPDTPLKHKHHMPERSKRQHDDLQHDLQVSPYGQGDHPSQQQFNNQDFNSVLNSEKKSSREADRINRPDPRNTKQRHGLSKAYVHPKSPFFSKVLSAARNSSKMAKERKVLNKKRRSSRKQVNRPRWHFRFDKHKDLEQQKIVREGEESDIDRHKHIDKTGHPKPKTLHGTRKNREEEAKKEEEEEEDGKEHERPEEFRKALSGGGRRKTARQRFRPPVKECVGCTEMEAKISEARELHKQVLAAQLLDKLRLEPRFTERPLPPKLPDQVFPHLPQQDHPGYPPREDQYYAKPTQLLIFGRDLGKHRLRKSRTGSYKFQLRNKIHGEVTSADLWVYKMHDLWDSHGQTMVVTQLHYAPAGRRLRERSLVARLDTHVQEGWLRFDVTRLVRSWLEEHNVSSSSSSSSAQPMLAIRCKTCYRTSYRAIFGVKSNFRPVLVIRERRSHPPEKSPPRGKRSMQCDPNTGCCKFDLTVRFNDLGIHEIFYPKTIRTGYCFGTCERPDLHYHNHTMLMQRLRYGSHSVVDPGLRDRLRPCCVPVVLQEASVMHYINDGRDTQVSLIPNLLVDKCGCA